MTTDCLKWCNVWTNNDVNCADLGNLSVVFQYTHISEVCDSIDQLRCLYVCLLSNFHCFTMKLLLENILEYSTLSVICFVHVLATNLICDLPIYVFKIFVTISSHI